MHLGLLIAAGLAMAFGQLREAFRRRRPVRPLRVIASLASVGRRMARWHVSDCQTGPSLTHDKPDS